MSLTTRSEETMQRELDDRLEELRRDLDRQDEAWTEVEAQFQSLADRGVAISRDVVSEFDEALRSTSRASMSLHHAIC
jgi:hypothetical protein